MCVLSVVAGGVKKSKGGEVKCECGGGGSFKSMLESSTGCLCIVFVQTNYESWGAKVVEKSKGRGRRTTAQDSNSFERKKLTALPHK